MKAIIQKYSGMKKAELKKALLSVRAQLQLSALGSEDRIKTSAKIKNLRYEQAYISNLLSIT